MRKLILAMIMALTQTVTGQVGDLINYQSITNNLGNFGNPLNYDDRFGAAIATLGDVNGDGITDIAVTAFRDDDGGTDRGAVYILFMDTNKTIKSYQKISMTSGNLSNYISLGYDDIFGSGISSAGDFNNDGIPDIMVGAQLDDDGATDAGAVYLIYLNTNGTVKNLKKISSTAGYGTGGINIQNGSNFGCETAYLGDINGDGIGDFAVGAYFDDQGGTNTGAVYILKMKANGTVKSYYKIRNGISNFNLTIGYNEYFGVSVGGLTDRNSDGIPDLAIGSYYYNSGQGAFYITYLDTNGIKGIKRIANGQGGMPSNSISGNFGISVRELPDINNNGIKDLIVGADYGNNNNYLLYMNTTNDVDSFKLYPQSQFGLSNTRLGAAVDFVGDLNNDGNYELVSGATHYNNTTGLVNIFSIKSGMGISIAKANAICENDSNGWIKVTPVGGIPPYSFTWSNGMLSDSIYYLSAGTYTVTITGSNSISTTQSIIISSNPPISLYTTNNATVCAGTNITLSAFALGGTNAGFQYHWGHTSSTAANQNTTVNSTTPYTVFATDNAGCSSDTTTITITTNPLPTVTASGLNVAYCGNDNSVYYLQGTPTGGSFSGLGVSGNTFNPSFSSSGTQQIIYSYTNSQGCTGKDTITTIVNAPPTVQFTGVAANYCVNSPNVNLSASPSGGVFTINNTPSTVFSPSTLGIGNYKIKYSVTDVNGCSNADSMFTYVNPVTVANFSGLASTYCDNAVAVTLLGTPTGGTFYTTGGGISGAQFNPSGLSAGLKNISYIYTNVYGCKDTATQSTTILASTPVSVSTAKTLFCNNESPISISVNPTGGTLSGTGVNNASQTFNPSIAGVGQKTITYTYTNANNCTTSNTQTVTVASPTTSFFTGLSSDYCVNDAPVVLTGFPTGGIFIGPGVTGSTFNPALAASGAKTIQYIYNNGCIDTSASTTTVYALPNVNLTVPTNSFCNNENAISLTTSPLGGNLTGQGITGNTFDPSAVAAGSYTLIYSYTDIHGCANSDTEMVVVQAIPTISFGSTQTEFCISNQADTLTATPTGGIWTGNGVINDLFISSIVGVGSNWYHYSYTSSNGCSNSDSIQLHVYPLPSVSLSGLDLNYCINSTADTLLGLPLGGTLSGTGLSGNIFDPMLAGLGNKVIQYQYIDTNNCSNKVVLAVNVHDIPLANAGRDTLIPCLSIGAPIGQNSQSGQSYFWKPSTGLTNSNIANPTAKPYTTTSYVLTVNNLATNCRNYDTVVVSLPPGPVITTSKDTVLCANQPLTLWASGADSVVWSSGQAGDSITINPTTSGNYILAGYNLYGCATFDTISVIVMPLPNPSFPYDSLVLNYPDSILLSPGSFDNYLWSTGDTTPSVLFHGGMVATISVIVTDSNGCSASDSITFLVESIDDVKLQIGVKIFPNPATDFLHIQMDRLVDIQRIEMMDMEGRMVLQRTYNAALQQIKLQLPNLNKGVYILRLIGSKGVIDLKVMVE